MKNVFSSMAFVLIIIWAIGYFAYNANGLFHLILVIAISFVIIQVLLGRRKPQKPGSL